MGIADLHIHTTHSRDGTASVATVLRRASQATDLDVIAITDHDEVRGALEAQDMASAYGIEVIPGCEISTAQGHLLALFIERTVAAGLSLVETVQRVGDLGGLCIAAHPMAHPAIALSADAIRTALQNVDVARILVGIEVFNAGLLDGSSNRLAQALGDSLSLAQVANSDSHAASTIGDGATLFLGCSAKDLRRALVSGLTGVIRRRQLSWLDVLGDWLPRYLLRRTGWDAWLPQAPPPAALAPAAVTGT